jgi:hypothetical protein
MNEKLFAFFCINVCFACKPVPHSEQKTLQNYVGTESRTMVCSGDYLEVSTTPKVVLDGSFSAVEKNALAAAVELSLSAIPPAFRDLLLDRIPIHLRKDLDAAVKKGEVCRGTVKLSDVTNASVEACLDIGATWTLYLEAIPAKVNHNMVRTLARMMSEVYADLVDDNHAESEFGVSAAKFQILRRSLVAALRLDIKDTASASKLQATSAMHEARLEHMVFAEAFDSYFCASTDTRPSFARLFPQAFGVFEPYAKQLERESIGLQPTSGPDVNTASFGLTEWYERIPVVGPLFRAMDGATAASQGRTRAINDMMVNPGTADLNAFRRSSLAGIKATAAGGFNSYTDAMTLAIPGAGYGMSATHAGNGDFRRAAAAGVGIGTGKILRGVPGVGNLPKPVIQAGGMTAGRTLIPPK